MNTTNSNTCRAQECQILVTNENEQFLDAIRAKLNLHLLNFADQHIARLRKSDEIRNDNHRAKLAAVNSGVPPKLAKLPAVLANIGINATVGIGKSRAVWNIIKQVYDAGLPVLVLVPTHDLADEYCEALKRLNVEHVHYYGRQSPITETDATTVHPGNAWVCYQTKASNDAGSKNHRPAQAVCTTCPNGLKVSAEKGIEKAIKWFKKHPRVDITAVDPCHFLYEALPYQLSFRVIVMPVQSFSEAAAVWQIRDKNGEIIKLIQRLVIVDEAIELAKETTITPADVSHWRDSLPMLQERLKRTSMRLSQQSFLSFDETQELQQSRLLLDLIPEIDDLFKSCIGLVGADLPPDVLKIENIHKKLEKVGGIHGGTARWEHISYFQENNESHFSVPLRAFTTLVENIKNGSLRVSHNAWHAYEVSPIIEWAVHHGSTLFLDATMSLPMITLIEATGGSIYEATAEQNMRVTRYTGHLYARGMVESEAYPRAVKTYIKEMGKIVEDHLRNPSAIITHKSYLKYALDEVTDDSAQDAADAFAEVTGTKIGWFGKHDRGHNDWEGFDLAVIGMPLLSPESVSKGYGAVRAALARVGVMIEAWDGLIEPKKTGSVPLPVQVTVRTWLLDLYAATLAQAIGRSRAVNQKRTVQVGLWGGLQTPAMDKALARFGVIIHVRQQNPVHRDLNSYYERGTAIEWIDQAINELFAVGATVSRRAVQGNLIAHQRNASAASIDARLAEYRAEGTLPDNRAGRPKRIGSPCIKGIPIHHEPIKPTKKPLWIFLNKPSSLPLPSQNKNRTPAPPPPPLKKNHQSVARAWSASSFKGAAIVGVCPPPAWAVGLVEVARDYRMRILLNVNSHSART